LKGDERSFLRLAPECFSVDLSEVESAVPLHKINDSIELLVYETSFVRDQRYPDDCTPLLVLMVDLRNGDVKPAFQAADHAFDDASLSLQRGYPLHMKLSCHHTDYHRLIFRLAFLVSSDVVIVVFSNWISTLLTMF